MTRPGPGKLKKKGRRYHTIPACTHHVGKLDTEIERVKSIIARLLPSTQEESEQLSRLRQLRSQLEAKRDLIQRRKEDLIWTAMTKESSGGCGISMWRREREKRTAPRRSSTAS